jgi:hypothetical protein
MKKIFFFFLLISSFSHAQLNNSWIDYTKTYYKFRLAKDTLCRIPQSTLAAAGLTNINADHFQLWRNGVEVRLYTSVSNNTLGNNDFIEFLGEMNDGKPDNQLYRNADFQLANRYSLETDTVSYFLTIDSSSTHLRYTSAVNNAPSTITPDAYFMRNIDFYYNNQINRGEAKVVGEYVYSSSYDPGEGWSSSNVAPTTDLVRTFTGLNVYTAGPANSFSVRVNAAGAGLNPRDLRIKVFQTVISTPPYSAVLSMPNFEYEKANIQNLPLSLFQNINSVSIAVNGTSTNIYDRIVVSNIGITYPATFNFNGLKSFSFDLQPSSSGNYLVINNFNFGSQQPLLFDLTSGLRYLGETLSTPGKVKFLLPPSAIIRSFKLINQDAFFNVNNLTTKNFIDLQNPDNQGNYIIISNQRLYDDGNGNNFVEAYRQYRSSNNGGGYLAKIYNIDELTDQFGFGIKNHPSSIRDFIQFAKSRFAQTPEYVFIIGRGVNYVEQKTNESNPVINQLDLVPTFGWPASDILLSSSPNNTYPSIPIGRLAAINGTEVNNYLSKMITYESTQQQPGSSIDDKAWMKQFIHVTGGKDSSENNTFKTYMNNYKSIVEDTLYGGIVESFSKTSTGTVQQASSLRIEELFNQGLGFVGYFGHSSANTFEFNLSNPDVYNNVGKYPFFNVSGCSAGNFYIYDLLRLSGSSSISEKYVLAPNRGSIGFLADTHFGIPPFLNFYNTNLYTSFCKTMYGNTIGNQMKSVIGNLGGENPSLDFFTRIHLEEINLHGDPALKINSFSKPDYVIEAASVKISPNIVTVADNNFNVSVIMRNIGKAVGDSIWVNVTRKLPNDTIRIIYRKLIPAIKSIDSISVNVPIFPLLEKGLNQINVTLDETNRIDEQYEFNNSVTKDFYIFEDELRPIYPYNYSIVNRQNISYFANTANPLSGIRDYKLEIDTTQLFNSPLKKIYNKSSIGGLIEFAPTDISYTDSTVYYWRVAMVPRNNEAYIWNDFSFVYLPSSSSGYNQSHYYQFLKSSYNDMGLDADRTFKFKQQTQDLIIRSGLYPFFDFDRINVNLDFNQVELWGCATLWRPRDSMENNLQFYVFDTNTLATWRNRNVNATNGLYGSRQVCLNSATPNDTTRAFFEFQYSNPINRKLAMDFIDSVPAGMYVAVTNFGNNRNKTFINRWKADTATLGSGNSLYHKFKSIGLDKVDSFYKNIPFIFFFKKGSTAFVPIQVVGQSDSSYLDQTIPLTTKTTEGYFESPIYGPATAWHSLHWRGTSADEFAADTVKVQVYGITSNGTTDLLAEVYPSLDTTLNFVDPVRYPYLKLTSLMKDTRYVTPNQMRYLRINADFAPEGAVVPSILFQCKDTLEQGEPLDFKLAFKNISDYNFDSLMKFKFVITDQNNQPHQFDIPNRKILVSGDTLIFQYRIDTKLFVGNNTIFVEFNPDNHQPEQYHFNNILFKNFFVKQDKYNPLLDVTFDGVHILNKDIVSSKPQILIKLKDESRYMELKDTSLIKLQLRYPDQTLHTFSFGDTMTFIPADMSSGANEATIEFNPYLPEDGEYELIVSGKDVVGNTAGNLEYNVIFSVINKQMISNLLNYPNPFTTSTAFVFTLTGNEVPQNLRIQILTITGKIVKEITKSELGDIHIGRNITSYKWDGKDMYGQPLGNGVYIYRVLTNHHNKSLEKYKSADDNTDRFFNKGYGKMYLMR